MIDPMSSLRILMVATKAPWPPVDGGRVVLLATLRALAAAGHRVEVIAPVAGSDDERRQVAAALADVCSPSLVAARPRSAIAAAVIGAARGLPAVVVRHALPAVRAEVAAALDRRPFDVVLAEQLHAMLQTGPARNHGVPVVHRAHNVESLLWGFAAEHRRFPARSALAFEARRMAACEVEALGRAAVTVTLCDGDRRVLSEMEPEASIHTVPPPYAAELAAGPAAVAGDPAVVTLVNRAWAPSRDAVRAFVRYDWPQIRRRLPGAVLHLFGGLGGRPSGNAVVAHPAPTDSADAFPTGAIALVPVRHPTGVPMKALEAWARGLPMVVDRATADILGARDGVDVVVGGPGGGWAAALARLADDEALQRRVIDGGRRALAERHDPAASAERLAQACRLAIKLGAR